MTATLTFNLPEDGEAFRAAPDAVETLAVIHDIDQTVRGCLKHGHEFKTPDEALEWVRKAFNDIPNFRL